MNTTFAGYDDTISYQAMQALDLALERIENTCSAITGVFREKLGGIEQRDAVTNVQVGIRYSSYTTKQFFYMMDLVTREILLDLLDMCKIVFKDGIIGTIILGDRLNKVFTALPEYYTMTDFDIHITDTSEMIKDSELLKQLSFEFSKNNNIDPEIVIDIITSKSLTKMKSDVTNAIRKKREESIEAMQMQQQLEAASKEVQRAQEEIRKLQSQVQQLNQEKLNIEKERLNKETEVAWYKARTNRDLKERELKVKENQVKAEVLQLYDSNSNNNEIKNI
jgi:CRISPR/Cas system CMR-associated protein Cmr5 small subunit